MRRVVRVIVWKEMRAFLRDKPLNGALLFTVLFSTIFTSWQFGSMGLLVGPLVAVFGGVYLFTWTAFNGERVNKTLASLLAAPIGMGELFLGKIIAVFIAAYPVGLLGLAVSGVIVWSRFGELPSPSTILVALVTIPIWGIVLSELLGLTYVLFGNPFILRLLMIFFLVGILNLGSAGGLNVSALSSAVVIPTGILVAVLLLFLIGRLDKERVVRT